MLFEIEYVSDEQAANYAEAARTGINDRWGLTSNEKLWVKHQPYLLDKGYQLRPRYRPGWVRSWEGTKRNPRIHEDSLTIESFKIMDAVRLSDGKRVIIKAFDTQITPSELHILHYLSTEIIQSNPRNHCACALDSFPVPDEDGWVFVVMDTYHSLSITPFETVGEVVEMIRQLLEGLVFMHGLNLAHRDCASTNIMMKADTLFKSTPHPHPSYSFLTEDRRNYVATLFPSYAERTLVVGAEGRERDIPELSTPNVPYDPFKVDVCIIGRFFSRDFYEKYGRSLYFLGPLIKRLIETDPTRRPTANEAFTDFELIRETLEPRILTRALDPNFFQSAMYSLSDGFHWTFSWFSKTILRRQPERIALP
ncbi:kinase domain protein [Rhizoctonia solani]|uniref:Kinase domain protein n=1 Tax=Rhizoctonia solani TaxID=456999 RepID=A0A8H8NZM0_9AGAM|nr:kinase domain protein [Rhizoctonia solani]QRW21218.1 kinase domain protein [Rhizoctonia solani]